MTTATVTAATKTGFRWIACLSCKKDAKWTVLFQRTGNVAFVMGRNHDYDVIGGTIKVTCRCCGHPHVEVLD